MKSIDVERFSCVRKLLRVTAWVKRFVDNLKRKVRSEEPVIKYLSIQEIDDAEVLWRTSVQ